MTKPPKYLVIVITLILSVLIALGGYIYYRYEKKRTIEETYNDLKAIADLKTDQLEQWQNERLAELQYFSQSYEFINSVEALIQKKDPQILQTIDQNIRLFSSNHSYENIILITLKGDVLYCLDPGLSCIVNNFQRKVESANSPSVQYSTDFNLDSITGNSYFDFIAPVIDQNEQIISDLVFRVNPESYLYPLIQKWPMPSRTAETLLIRQEGDSIIFLNELRHMAGTALKLKMPMTLKTLPAVQAVSGRTGYFEGVDYRKKKVISYLRNIPGTNWYMVTKIDRSEVFRDLYVKATLTSIASFIAIVLLITLIGWYFNNRQKNIYQQLLQHEIELHQYQEEFRATLYSIGDAVITTDKQGVIRQMNPVAEKITGWTEAEAKDKPLKNVFNILNEDSRVKVEDPVEQVLREGKTIGLANHTLLINRNNQEIPIADSGAPIRDKKGNIIGVVLVFSDQTKDRSAQKILSESEERYRSIFENVQDVYFETTSDGKIMVISPSVEIISQNQYKPDDFIGETMEKFYYDLSERERLLSKLQKDGKVSDFEIRLKNRDKSIVYCALSAKYLYDESGNDRKCAGHFSAKGNRTTTHYSQRKSSRE